tara:strand:- start:134 stop:541 length:408 start_codon:yes stop_codon:yes gene_type:complete
MLINKFNKKSKRFFLLIVIIFIVFSLKFEFFKNTYLILIKDSETRKLSNYGYCNPMGYGFIRNIKIKFKLNNQNISVKNKDIYPTSAIFTINPKNKDTNKQILLNYKKKDLEKITKKFNILENYKECYLIEFLSD